MYVMADTIYVVNLIIASRNLGSNLQIALLRLPLFAIVTVIALAWQVHDYNPDVDPYVNTPHLLWVISLYLLVFSKRGSGPRLPTKRR